MTPAQTMFARLIAVTSAVLALAAPAEGATVTVNCGTGTVPVLQPAIDAARDGDTLLVQGTCNENVQIYKVLTLDGRGTARITASSGVVVNITGRSVTFRRFQVTGGGDFAAITVGPGAQAQILSNTIRDARGVGIMVNTTFAAIRSNAIRNNAGGGIEICCNATAVIERNTITGNAFDGVIVTQSATASIEANNIISGNSENGVVVDAASSANVGGNTINGNGRNGILVSANSTVEVGHDEDSGPNTTTLNNGRFGLRCEMNSSARGRLGTLRGASGVKSFPSGEACVDRTTP